MLKSLRELLVELFLFIRRFRRNRDGKHQVEVARVTLLIREAFTG